MKHYNQLDGYKLAIQAAEVGDRRYNKAVYGKFRRVSNQALLVD